MKENTKFLWMYVGILFSFALILIIFAGLSQNTDSEQTQGLKEDITELSQKNTELHNLNDELQKKIVALLEENTQIKSDADIAKQNITKRDADDQVLMDAYSAQRKGQKNKARELLSSLDYKSLTQAQQYIYNKLSY